jgi:hypothetical protein
VIAALKRSRTTVRRFISAGLVRSSASRNQRTFSNALPRPRSEQHPDVLAAGRTRRAGVARAAFGASRRGTQAEAHLLPQ